MEKLLKRCGESDSMKSRSVLRVFEDYLFQITCTLFEEAIRRLDGSLRLKEDDVKLYSRFYSYGMCGIIRDWVRGGMKESPKSLSLRIRKLANDSEKMATLRLQGQF
ncbi:MAG: TetR-like C-terminal domain-containing protein [Holdemania massiliensis]